MADAIKKARTEARRAQIDFERAQDDAKEARRKAFARAQKAGLSLRQISEEVGLHYSRVAEIIRGD
jgi:DNA-directed RNA polymerase specialized sigma24 family protein